MTIIQATALLLAVAVIGGVLYLLHRRAMRDAAIAAEEAIELEKERVIDVACEFLEDFAHAKQADNDTRTAAALRCAARMIRKGIYVTPDALQNQSRAHEPRNEDFPMTGS